MTITRASGSIDVHVVSHDYVGKGRVLPRLDRRADAPAPAGRAHRRGRAAGRSSTPICAPSRRDLEPGQRHAAVPARRSSSSAWSAASTRRSSPRSRPACCSTTTSCRRSTRSPSQRRRTSSRWSCSSSSPRWCRASSTWPPAALARRPAPTPRPRRCRRWPAACCAASRPCRRCCERVQETFGVHSVTLLRRDSRRPASAGAPSAASRGRPARHLVVRGQHRRRPVPAARGRRHRGPGRRRPALVAARARAWPPRISGCWPPSRPRSRSPTSSAGWPRRPRPPSRWPRPTGCAPRCSTRSATTCAPRSPRPRRRCRACAARDVALERGRPAGAARHRRRGPGPAHRAGHQPARPVPAAGRRAAGRRCRRSALDES